jgi:hypothetical protein
MDLGAHMFAIVATILVVAAVPIVAYGVLVVVGIVIYGDPGGWLNFVAVPIASFLLGLICAIAFIPLSLIALRLGRASMLAPLAIIVLAFGAWELFIGRPASGDLFVFHALGGALALYLGGAFLAYLAVFLVSRKVLGILTPR